MQHKNKQKNKKQKKWKDKQYAFFKMINCWDYTRKNLKMAKKKKKKKKGHLKRETRSLLMAVQNNYIKAKIDTTPQNSECRLLGLTGGRRGPI